MMDLPPTLDLRDLFYVLVGLALLGLTLQSALAHVRWINIPAFYVLTGIVAAAWGLPTLTPLGSELEAKILEHLAELIVIISLAGAGLAIDTPMTWRNWRPAFLLLLITMPLTMAAVFALGFWGAGLSLASAMLLAAAMAPTDPVLARSVQVGPPGTTEKPMKLSLTAEAGLNDGLAFPFIYLAIGLATYGISNGLGWLANWAFIDLAYRVAAGIGAGYVVGFAISRWTFSPQGDAAQGSWNATVVALGATLLSYGIAEAIDGYGFLAVFFAARAVRILSRKRGKARYEEHAHHGADQLETILLALLLLWVGSFIGQGGLQGLTWVEISIAVGLIFLIRPISGDLALRLFRCKELERRKVAFFGVRGMGSIFYIAYAQNHADFSDMDAVWRIAVVTIALSIFVHGFAANVLVSDDGPSEPRAHPRKSG